MGFGDATGVLSQRFGEGVDGFHRARVFLEAVSIPHAARMLNLKSRLGPRRTGCVITHARAFNELSRFWRSSSAGWVSNTLMVPTSFSANRESADIIS